MDNDGKGTNAGMIAGLVIAAVVIVVAIILIVIYTTTEPLDTEPLPPCEVTDGFPQDNTIHSMISAFRGANNAYTVFSAFDINSKNVTPTINAGINPNVWSWRLNIVPKTCRQTSGNYIYMIQNMHTLNVLSASNDTDGLPLITTEPNIEQDNQHFELIRLSNFTGQFAVRNFIYGYLTTYQSGPILPLFYFKFEKTLNPEDARFRWTFSQTALREGQCKC